MFYCKTCATKNSWPYEFWYPMSYGPCEECGKTTTCVDVAVNNLVTSTTDDQPTKPTSKELRIGQKVTYVSYSKLERGIVKSISDSEHVFVVYHCDGNWDKYYDYTGALTDIKDLIEGW